MPLEEKINLAKRRIREWYEYWEGEVYISFSGGKDSTVLLHLVKDLYPDVPAVFVDTGLEFPEVRTFARANADIVLKPKMRFDEVIKKYGYPVISKEQALYIYEYRNTKSEKLRHKRLYGDEKGGYKISKKWQKLINSDFNISNHCCNIMKKNPFKQYEKKTGKKCIVGTMAKEGSLRKNEYIRNGCNAFNSSRPISKPLSVWTEQDILKYLSKYDIPYASVYGEIKQDDNDRYYCTGRDRTGCVFCGFGCHLEPESNRFQQLKETHPKLYNYCIGGGCYDDRGLWVPNKEGLGMGHVLDEIGVKYD